MQKNLSHTHFPVNHAHLRVYHRKKLTQHNRCRILVICREIALITIFSQYQGMTKIVPLAMVCFGQKVGSLQKHCFFLIQWL